MNLAELQNNLLKGLKFIDNLCSELEVKYFIISGTLLGAVRHKGFIPWDFDADIGMLRDEYDKFLKLCKDKHFDNYILESAEYDSSSKISFTRLGIKDIYIRNKNTSSEYMVYIDIFPFDNTLGRKNNYEKLLQFEFKLLKSLKAIRYEKNVTESKLKDFILLSMSKVFFPKINVLSKKILKLARKFDNFNTEYATNYSSIYGFIRETQLKKDLEECFLVDFEGEKLQAPNNFDRVLKNLYNEYWVIPEEKNRKTLDLSFFEIVSTKEKDNG